MKKEVYQIAYTLGEVSRRVPIAYLPNPKEFDEAIFNISKFILLPKIVCLCGSTRFMDKFFEVGWDFTLKGYIVLSVGVCKHATDHGGEALGQEVADKLDELHLRKIALADEVYILNVNGYIGDSTRKEIEYARSIGKPISYLEPEDVPEDAKTLEEFCSHYDIVSEAGDGPEYGDSERFLIHGVVTGEDLTLEEYSHVLEQWILKRK